MNIVGPQVKAIRTSKHLSQDVVAARCNLLNWPISRGTYAKIEARRRRVTDDEVLLLARALKVPLAKLFPSEAEDSP